MFKMGPVMIKTQILPKNHSASNRWIKIMRPPIKQNLLYFILNLMTQKINLQQFNAQELYQLKQGFQSEIKTLGQSLSQLRFALDKYEQGKRSIKALQECEDNQELLMPLSSSLYIQGYLNNRKNGHKVYLVEYGAGFFVERTAKESMQFYNRKIALIKEKVAKLQEIINQKRQNFKTIQVRLINLMQQQQQQKR